MARPPRGCVLRSEALGAQLPEGKAPLPLCKPQRHSLCVSHKHPPRPAWCPLRLVSGPWALSLEEQVSVWEAASLVTSLRSESPALCWDLGWGQHRGGAPSGWVDGTEMVNVWLCFHWAEFKKTDKSILVSPTGPSRVAFNPEQKPLHGVLKTPTSSPISTLLGTKKPLTTAPRRRPTAMDFF